MHRTRQRKRIQRRRTIHGLLIKARMWPWMIAKQALSQTQPPSATEDNNAQIGLDWLCEVAINNSVNTKRTPALKQLLAKS